MGMTTRILSALTILVAAGSPALAQVPRFNVSLGARIGMFSPLGNLGTDVSGRETKISPGLAYGASIEVDIPASPINVRANVDAAMGRSIEVDGDEIPGTDVDLIVFTGDLVWRPVPRMGAVQPYLLAGAGIKLYEAEGTFDSDDEVTGHLGLGADFRAGPLSIFGEISDYISSVDVATESELQNDLFVMVGIRIGLL